MNYQYFKTKEQGKITGPKRDEVGSGGYYNKEFCNLYSSVCIDKAVKLGS
jgi:hypothetical protein